MPAAAAPAPAAEMAAAETPAGEATPDMLPLFLHLSGEVLLLAPGEQVALTVTVGPALARAAEETEPAVAETTAVAVVGLELPPGLVTGEGASGSVLLGSVGPSAIHEQAFPLVLHAQPGFGFGGLNHG